MQIKGNILKEEEERMVDCLGMVRGVFRKWWEQEVVRLWKVQDKRRVVHSLKVGLGLALISVVIFFDKVYRDLGPNVVWAVMTVVLVLEPTVGGTLSKGLNRGIGTLLAGSLGLFIDYISNQSGSQLEPFVLGFALFVAGVAITYLRFVPSIKARFDYGMIIFLITFSMVVVSGYHLQEINISVAFDRLVMVILGGALALIIAIFVNPFWAGEDLHNSVVKGFNGLATSLEECVKQYFKGELKAERNLCAKMCKLEAHEDPIYKGYRAVLISKQSEEASANLASWEPRHGKFGYMYPWTRYVKVGATLRHCAYTISALHGCLQSDIQVDTSMHDVFSQPFLNISTEIACIFRELGDDIKQARRGRSKENLMKHLDFKVETLHHCIKSHLYLFKDEVPIDLQQSVASPDNVAKEKAQQQATALVASKAGEIGHVDEICIELGMSRRFHQVLLQQQQPRGNKKFAESLAIASVASLLVEIVARLEHLIEAVKELERMANFKEAHVDATSSSDVDTKYSTVIKIP